MGHDEDAKNEVLIQGELPLKCQKEGLCHVVWGAPQPVEFVPGRKEVPSVIEPA